MTTDPKSTAERGETDTSLRSERERADAELAKRVAVHQAEADDVVDLARDRADAVLGEARDKVDAMRDENTPLEEELSDARADEDEALAEERAAADDALQVERAEQEEALALLLALEREETDDRLVAERARSDFAVASRDDFLGIVSHDVRGLLGGIALSAELVAKLPLEGEHGARAHAEAARLRRLTGQMNRLVGDLLDVVGMESGKLTVVETEQDAAALLAETIERFHLPAGKLGVTLTAETPGGTQLARFDRDRMLQVLTNLVGNALKFARGSVVLALIQEQDGLRFTVRDDGCGIAADQLEAVFERFSRLAQEDRRGLGLGLYIARCIVAAHRGRIWAESEVGAGSTFHFTLPADPPSGRGSAPPLRGTGSRV